MNKIIFQGSHWQTVDDPRSFPYCSPMGSSLPRLK
ncbi:hypothetical protein LINPERHAP1_LOCUS8422 [Linum perenne]